MGFGGLIYTDSMKMAAIVRMARAGDAAVRAAQAGADVILDSPDSAAAVEAIAAAVTAGQIPRAQIERSVRRILEAKARLGLHKARLVNLEAVALSLGGRKHDAVARAVSDRAVTLIKDARNSVPLPTPRTGSVLYLSVLDYPSGWRIAAPSRTMIPELKSRWPATESFEISDRTTPAELDMVRALAAKVRRGRRRRLRARLVRQRPARSRPASGAAAARHRTRQRAAVAAVRDGVLRQPVHGDGRARGAGHAADV